MPLKITCPRCGVLHRNIDKALLGEQFQCSCGKVVRLGSTSASARPRPVPKPVERKSRPAPPAVARPDPGFPVAPVRAVENSRRPAPKPVQANNSSKKPAAQKPPARPEPSATTRVTRPEPAKNDPPAVATSPRPQMPPKPAAPVSTKRPVSPVPSSTVAPPLAQTQPAAAAAASVPASKPKPKVEQAKTDSSGKRPGKPSDKSTPVKNDPYTISLAKAPTARVEEVPDDAPQDSVDMLIHDLAPKRASSTGLDGTPPKSQERWNNRNDDDLGLAESTGDSEPSFEVLDSFEVLEDEVIVVDIVDEDVVEDEVVEIEIIDDDVFVVCAEDVVEIDEVIEITAADLLPQRPKPQ